ncbi:hypothetical protein HMPREF1531_01875 [Propionibacterium sp. oral taxon 192 str. F0372]|uniref:thioesterase II family protein n=1 Tax=Propionibacterium sp. oral taxon 192 TaxID=671222 RepID=UPI0003527282|nr:alpha/beta fold hydrolase [Propionibacterium sp. oral taxon 192]EPH02567.1 hypothetical protein HMPREF1531_01875 [Propionibacterium sp. oral taxon 192 str. F0372]
MIVSRDPFPFVHEPRRGRLVFCFHHAGGNASSYRPWVGIHPDLDVIPVELPGKATRMKQPWVGDFSSLGVHLASEISRIAVEPVVLYGHSMGAAMAYQVAACLQGAARVEVAALVVAGRQAPGQILEGEYHSSMGLAALKQELVIAGGTPAEILADEAAMDLLLGPIQRDYMLHESFEHHSTILDAPILAFAGNQDPTLDSEAMRLWSGFTRGRFRLVTHDGGHFFPLEDQGFLDRLAEELEDLLR